MKHNPSLLEALGITLLVAVLVTSGVLLAGYESNFASPTMDVVKSPSMEVNVVTGINTPTSLASSPTNTVEPTICPQPDGWETYVMQNGDSLEALATERVADLGEVMGANCLTRPGALPGSTIYLPRKLPTLTFTITQTLTITPTPTSTLRPCEYPAGWLRYEVKAGDTIFKLGVRFRVSEVELVTGNCLSLGSILHPGDVLLVPEQPTITPTPRK
jgi:LysM repeat protein